MAKVKTINNFEWLNGIRTKISGSKQHDAVYILLFEDQTLTYILVQVCQVPLANQYRDALL